MLGAVSEFDDAAGLGAVSSEDGVYLFHCTQIADGSRSIAVGTPVTFDVAPRLGRWEAIRLRPC